MTTANTHNNTDGTLAARSLNAILLLS